MKRWLKILWCLILLISLPIAAESLVAGNAYIISSINQDPSATIQPEQKYSLVPQVIVYDGTSQYVGSVTKFSGCYDGKLYDKGVNKGTCLTSVVNNLTSTSTTEALSAAKGKELQDQINELKNLINNLQSNPSVDFDSVYPVGSIYMSTSNTNPKDLFGGTWVALDEGRVLIGANSTYTAGSTGGNVSVSHTHSVTASGTISGTALTTAQLPSHSHTATIGNGSTPYLSTVTTGGANPSDYSTSSVTVPKNGTTGWLRSGEESGGYYDQVMKFTNSSTSHSHTISIGSTGSGQAHTHTFTGAATTSTSATINNMQPYLAVYMWKRTA